MQCNRWQGSRHGQLIQHIVGGELHRVVHAQTREIRLARLQAVHNLVLKRLNNLLAHHLKTLSAGRSVTHDRQALLVGGDRVVAHDLAGNVGGAVHHGERQLLSHGQGLAGDLIHDAPLLRGNLPAGSIQLVLVLRTQAANQVTSVNVHGAAGLAHAVHGAGVDAVVLVLLTQMLR